MAYVENRYESVSFRIAEIEKKLSVFGVVPNVTVSRMKALEDDLSMLKSIRDLLLGAINHDRATG